MAPKVGRWLTDLVEDSESESDSASSTISDTSMRDFSSNIDFMEDFSSDISMKDFSDDDSKENSSDDDSSLNDSSLCDSSSDDSLNNSSSNDSLKEKVQDILLGAINQLDTMRYVNPRRQIIRIPALMEN